MNNWKKIYWNTIRLKGEKRIWFQNECYMHFILEFRLSKAKFLESTVPQRQAWWNVEGFWYNFYNDRTELILETENITKINLLKGKPLTEPRLDLCVYQTFQCFSTYFSHLFHIFSTSYSHILFDTKRSDSPQKHQVLAYYHHRQSWKLIFF